MSNLPTLTIDPPENFLRNPASGANFQWYDSTITNATLRIYSFRPFAGDVTGVFQQTLFSDWTALDPVSGLTAPPTVQTIAMIGADTALAAAFNDVTGRSHLRLAFVANGGRALAIVHLRAETPLGLQQVLPSFTKVLDSMRITTEAPRLSRGPARADTGAVAGLYMAPRVNLLPFPGGGPVASTYFYLFSTDGRVYRGYGLPRAPGGDISGFDYAAAARDDPENTGTFEIRGTQLVIRMGWQYPYTITTNVPDRQGRVTIENATFSLQVR